MQLYNFAFSYFNNNNKCCAVEPARNICFPKKKKSSLVYILLSQKSVEIGSVVEKSSSCRLRGCPFIEIYLSKNYDKFR
jgi:hypothetical protein